MDDLKLIDSKLSVDVLANIETDPTEYKIGEHKKKLNTAYKLDVDSS